MVKRVTDVLSSVLGLCALSPLLLWFALRIKLEDGGPVLYRGLRVGKGVKPFRIFKFRTMAVDAEQMGGSSTPEDDPRVTRVGHFLRRHKLDELPELINVLRGEMSLVGPRPQVAWAVERYDEEAKAILNVRPGITDYASIKFRDEGEILRGSPDPDRAYMEKIEPEKRRLALVYVRDHNFWTDVKILWATMWVLLGGSPETVIAFPGGHGSHARAPQPHEVTRGHEIAKD